MSQKIASLPDVFPDSALVEQLNQLFAQTSRDNLLWTSGYCYGLAQQKSGNSVTEKINATFTEPEKKQSIWVAYGSQTGNAKKIAEELSQNLTSKQFKVELKSFADIQPRQLKNCDLLFAVVSTQGEGDPPEDSVAFFEALTSKRAPDLAHLSFSVLGLGDSSYEFFCATSKQLDERLAELKAKRLLTRLDADIDYQDLAKQWQESIVEQLNERAAHANSSSIGNVSVVEQPKLTVVTSQKACAQSGLVTGEIIVNQKITARGSSKSVNHIEIALPDENFNYLPGDSLGVVIKNSQQQVAQIIETTAIKSTEPVVFNSQSLSLESALINKTEITRIHPKVIQAYALHNPKLLKAIESEGRALLLKISQQYQLIDLLQEYPVELQPQDLIDILQPKAERLYSIASSLEAYPDEVHLTVAAVEYQKNSQSRFGSASQYLSCLQEGESLEIYLKANNHFRLPENSETPIIMVGPGTGIAPFRGFLQHRQALQRQTLKQAGKNWLFFGNPNFHSDFLYQLEWQKLLKEKILTKMDVAFSRDQAQKIYVQDRIKENAREIYDWFENGASFYLCGDASTMAKDVENTLIEVVSQQAAKDIDFGKAYLSQMKADKRFLKDVY